MNYELRTNKGMTLTETTIVIGVAALLTALSLPAVRTFFSSMATAGNTRSLISAALSSARAIAAKEQRYAGIRFQKAGDPNNVLNAPQYMIFIVQDPNIGAYFFRAVEGIQPIKLSDNVGVMDFAIVSGRNQNNPVNPGTEYRLDDPTIGNAQKDTLVGNPNGYRDTTAFSIVFSPSGKLVIHGIRIRNRDSRINNASQDDVFNTWDRVMGRFVTPAGMFVQDDYFGGGSDFGLGPEPSRSSFIIYETDKFRQAYGRGRAWSDYLSQLRPVYINPYTGTIVNSGQ